MSKASSKAFEEWAKKFYLSSYSKTVQIALTRAWEQARPKWIPVQSKEHDELMGGGTTSREEALYTDGLYIDSARAYYSGPDKNSLVASGEEHHFINPVAFMRQPELPSLDFLAQHMEADEFERVKRARHYSEQKDE